VHDLRLLVHAPVLPLEHELGVEVPRHAVRRESRGHVSTPLLEQFELFGPFELLGETLST
jgi:hypothetical protein